MHMLDLISMTKELHYENYRQQQMETRKFGEPTHISIFGRDGGKRTYSSVLCW
ncbi:uncharacterized protein EDB91DRAFT_1169937 [Suillus paluster]|uniref:uncharacterized protein n=1 Tax=Suillus paluster TaxID=48578 RepID=UPI001B87844E|nr:uncharacterized protein EDB91DRAFT_1179615 [Suillus paluster]XP_041169038.1 uncharacterized protein EDB91DRAFT_1177437 [Suillus paluster]XP_041170648.1 uncharacterized protein EDB91DRAFT_1169937 [Suillus paluster]KAG1719817.1 hypothetical protein EDB91DRAFT_1179615 [Suillus paluster]KAG1720721.1 hypothetical protein EDB91DRAFT_1177437 [Suillus paluster]KAG1724820.1 hypothetical protein EDB91DRAFT_1169937 [Suillus paluster]